MQSPHPSHLFVFRPFDAECRSRQFAGFVFGLLRCDVDLIQGLELHEHIRLHRGLFIARAFECGCQCLASCRCLALGVHECDYFSVRRKLAYVANFFHCLECLELPIIFDGRCERFAPSRLCRGREGCGFHNFPFLFQLSMNEPTTPCDWHIGILHESASPATTICGML